MSNKIKGRNINCKICNKKIWVIPSREKDGRGKYCSKKCSNIGMKETSYIVTRTEEQRLSDIKKSSITRGGSNSHLWRGGVTSLRMQIYHLDENKEWRNKIYERDDYTCQICGTKGYKLNADHIKSFSLIKKENNIKTLDDAINCEELWDINNGRTLCKDCHNKTDNYGWKAFKETFGYHPAIKIA